MLFYRVDLLYQRMLECRNNSKHGLHKVLKDDQWNILCPPNKKTYSKDFDITLLVAVIRSVVGLKPKGGWNIKELQSNDRSKGAFVFLALKLRNKIKHSSVESLKDLETFHDYWKRIRGILEGFKFEDMKSFEYLKTCPLDKHIDTITKLVDALESEVKKSIGQLKKDIVSMQNSISRLDNEKADKTDMEGIINLLFIYIYKKKK